MTQIRIAEDIEPATQRPGCRQAAEIENFFQARGVFAHGRAALAVEGQEAHQGAFVVFIEQLGKLGQDVRLHGRLPVRRRSEARRGSHGDHGLHPLRCFLGHGQCHQPAQGPAQQMGLLRHDRQHLVGEKFQGVVIIGQRALAHARQIHHGDPESLQQRRHDVIKDNGMQTPAMDQHDILGIRIRHAGGFVGVVERDQLGHSTSFFYHRGHRGL